MIYEQVFICSYIQLKENVVMEERMKIENCSCSTIHEDVVKNVKENIPDSSLVQSLIF